jgi:hypothetical protein
MKRLTHSFHLAVATAAALLLAAPIGAEQAANDFVPFKVTGKGTFSGMMIPLSPPVFSTHVQLKGETSGLGAFTASEVHTGNAGVDGLFKSVTDGKGAMVGATGDALYFTWSGLLHTSAKGEITGEGAFLITGGKGKYCGAAGSGSLTTHPNGATGELTFEWDGLIQMPPKA